MTALRHFRQRLFLAGPMTKKEAEMALVTAPSITTPSITTPSIATAVTAAPSIATAVTAVPTMVATFTAKVRRIATGALTAAAGIAGTSPS